MIRNIRYVSLILVLISVVFKLELISLFAFFAYMITLLYDKVILVKYIYIIFLIGTNVFGVYSIEYSSLFLYEIEQHTQKAYSLAPIILLHLIFLETIFLFENNRDRINFLPELKGLSTNIKEKLTWIFNAVFNAKIIQIISIIGSLILVVLFILVIDKPYFKLGIDRFAYKDQILSFYEYKIGNLLLYFMPIFYLAFRSNKIVGLLPILLFNLYFLWIGHKFSIFIMGLQLGLLVIVHYLTIERLNKFVLRIGLIFGVLILGVFIQNAVVHGIKLEENANYIKSRLAQQGQLWWGVFKEEEYHKLHLKEAKLETELFFEKNADNDEKRFDLGMYKVMRLVAPEERVEFKIDQGSRYAYSTQANLLYYFNYPILIILTIFMALGFAVITTSLQNSIITNNFINIILLSKLYITYVRFLSNSDFHTIFSLENVFIIVIVVLINFLYKNKNVIRET